MRGQDNKDLETVGAPGWALPRLGVFLFVFALATVFGFVQDLQNRGANPGPFSWHNYVWGFVLWYLYLPILAAGAKLGRQFPVTRSRGFRNISIHIVAASALAAIHPFAVVLIDAAVIQPRWWLLVAKSLFPYMRFWAFQDVATTALLYALAAIAGQAFFYYQNYQESRVHAARLAAQLANAKLAALKMQIHPHFLLNALHSISSLQMIDTAAAQKMTALLGDFLRMTLRDTNQEEVSLRQELEFLRHYLAIVKMRFGDRLKYRIEAPPAILDAAVPQLILQPIVENAVRHGIAPHGAGGEIVIRATRDHDRLHLEVKDTGPGISPEHLSPATPRGLGLSNTRARLVQLYGSKHVFSLENAPEAGLRVIIEIPYHVNEHPRHELSDEPRPHTHADR